MNEVSRILTAIAQGDPRAAAKLLPLVYDELRYLAAQKLAHESAGQTLQPTALVHEAYLRLVGLDGVGPAWHNRGHFFAAAAEAMRRILIDNARRKRSQKHGGGLVRQDVDLATVAAGPVADDVLGLDEALTKLAATEPSVAELVKLRYFAGLTNREAAELLGVSPRTADSWWKYARAWLLAELHGADA
jgi:RNA polymerase sigma factor (TIGR02999 family)